MDCTRMSKGGSTSCAHTNNKLYKILCVFLNSQFQKRHLASAQYTFLKRFVDSLNRPLLLLIFLVCFPNIESCIYHLLIWSVSQSATPCTKCK